jgi:hypothetical protein
LIDVVPFECIIAIPDVVHKRSPALPSFMISHIRLSIRRNVIKHWMIQDSGGRVYYYFRFPFVIATLTGKSRKLNKKKKQGKVTGAPKHFRSVGFINYR